MQISKRVLIYIITLVLIFSSLSSIAEPVYATRVRLNKKHIRIYPGGKRTLKLKHCKRRVKWRSTNKRVATVSKNGKVKAISPGNATIIAKCAGKKKFKCRVRVKFPAYTHIYAHRGDARNEVEHTIKAYDSAIVQGALNIEPDVVLSKDGTIYVSHDLSAYRITGVDKLYEDMSDEEIEKLRTIDGQKILKLSEVFDRYKDNVKYIIELKNYSELMIQKFEELIDSYQLQNNIIVQCFDVLPLEELDKYYPNVKMLYLCRTSQIFYEGINNSAVDIVSVPKHLMNKKRCNAAHKKGKKFNVYVLKTKSQIKRAINMGVNNYFTNNVKLSLKLERKYR